MDGAWTDKPLISIGQTLASITQIRSDNLSWSNLIAKNVKAERPLSISLSLEPVLFGKL